MSLELAGIKMEWPLRVQKYVLNKSIHKIFFAIPTLLLIQLCALYPSIIT